MRTANTMFDTALSGGGSGQVIQTLTASATIAVETTYVRADATSGNVTVTLPPLSLYKIGDTIMVKRIDASGNTVTVAGSGSENLDGSNTTTITAGSVKRFIDVGSRWDII